MTETGLEATQPPHPRPYVPGTAPIKPEYILSRDICATVDDDAAESHTGPVKRPSTENETPQDINGGNEESDGPPAVKKLKGAARKRAKKEAASAKHANGKEQGSSSGGSQNKNRVFAVLHDGFNICNSFAELGRCHRGDSCKLSHDIKSYLQAKALDIYLPQPPVPSPEHLPLQYGALWRLSDTERDSFLDQNYSTQAPFTKFAQDEAETSKAGESSPEKSLRVSTTCPLYHSTKTRKIWDANSSKDPLCPYGFRCRFLGGHVRHLNEDDSFENTGLRLPWDSLAASSGREDSHKVALDEHNQTLPDLQRRLRKREYDLARTRAVMQVLRKEDIELPQAEEAKGPIFIPDDEHLPPPVSRRQPDDDDLDALANAARPEATVAQLSEAENSQTSSSIDQARIRRSEKRKLDWYHGELYLAPLTTTGNLPFRRICSTFGSDIHCGEMGLAASYLEGNKSEWSLARRWEGERTFGVQLCGNKPDLLVPTAELMSREFGTNAGLDFVDINCGCPIDMVFTRGGGSALLDHPKKLGRIVRGMDAVLGDIPVTIKLRTGVTDKRTSHYRIMPKAQTDWGVGAVTMHGRSRKQRYSKKADWAYIKQCADELRESVRSWNEESKTADEEEMRPIPVYGNGDVYSQQEYYENLEQTGVDGEMIARGALIKPWIFTEIKERRDWDISSRERLDIVRQFASYGLSHWGSDTQGVNRTRRFLCEAMSFWHRYVPLGILEHLPPSMNDRPPAYRGRDDLETLLSSDNKADWVKLSEMFLGKSPDTFDYVPKHKSNSYADSAEQQG